MHRFGLLLGLLLVVLQNLVFWQSLLPQAELGQQVCVQISRALQSPSNLHSTSQAQQSALPPHADHALHAEYNSPPHHAGLDHDAQQANKHHTQSNSDCHFCQLFHAVVPLFKPNCRLQSARILIKFSLASPVVDLLLYVKQLFLKPQSRAPPFFLSLA